MVQIQEQRISMYRINRYIMECKYAQMKLRAYQENQELIDTLWNVNERNKDNAKYYSEQN